MRNTSGKIVLFLFVIAICSCDFFKKETNGTPIARVSNNYLYMEDVQDLIPENLSAEDSLARLNNLINQWATQQLLMNGARLNLSEEKQSSFDQLIKQYELDLYTKAYTEALVKQNIDTTITTSEAEKVYESNMESFKLNDELIKFRYVHLDKNNTILDEIEERLKRFDEEDKTVLDSISLQFRSYNLNDSIWIKVNNAVQKIPAINPENRDQLLKKTNFIQLEDSLGVYLMRIEDVKRRNEIAPLEYVMPTIKQIVINKRKLDFIKQLEKDITRDAVRNGQFEIYK